MATVVPVAVIAPQARSVDVYCTTHSVAMGERASTLTHFGVLSAAAFPSFRPQVTNALWQSHTANRCQCLCEVDEKVNQPNGDLKNSDIVKLISQCEVMS
eukprot:GHVN01034043.1.p2 GENE.GHVN01034043.1~~GHVN01034043.1.p2  ORF type:complete len:100 (+),score=18.62 GHVN01034043.1:88-387(+)